MFFDHYTPFNAPIIFRACITLWRIFLVSLPSLVNMVPRYLNSIQPVMMSPLSIDALFILSLFRLSTSACFGHVCSPSSGGILYIYNNCYVLWDSIPSRPTDSQLKSTTPTNCCIYTVYLLMMDYTHARNMERLTDEIN